MTVVVDAYDSSERAMGWFSHLENEIEFPFSARCATKRAISPLLVGDEVDGTGMAPAGECEAEIFVMIRWVAGSTAAWVFRCLNSLPFTPMKAPPWPSLTGTTG